MSEQQAERLINVLRGIHLALTINVAGGLVMAIGLAALSICISINHAGH